MKFVIIDCPLDGNAVKRRNFWYDRLQNVAEYFNRPVDAPIAWDYKLCKDCRQWLVDNLMQLANKSLRSIIFVHSNNWWSNNDNNNIDLVTLAQQYVETLFVIYSGDGAAGIPTIQNCSQNIHIFQPVVNRDGTINYEDSGSIEQLQIIIAGKYYDR